MSGEREIGGTRNVCQKFGKLVISESRILECMVKKERRTEKLQRPRTDAWATSVFRKKASTIRGIQRIQRRDGQKARKKTEILQRSRRRMIS